MDIPRPSFARTRRIRRALYAAGAVVLLAAITLGVSRLRPAAPSVERTTVWMDAVKRGPMLRQVRGLGTLVPEEIRWIPAVTEGQVERIVMRPGAVVAADTVILELSNPELDRQVLDAEMQLKKSEAELANLRVQLESQHLNQQADAARIEADFTEAKLRAERDAELVKLGLVSDLNFRISQGSAESWTKRRELEQKRLAMASKAIESQLAAKNAEVEQYRALYLLRGSQRGALRLRAGVAGVLQQVPVEVGQRVAPGTNLARVVNPRRLKAEIRIAETQAKDIQIGQRATIDTRNGEVTGHVIRIDPAVQNGTVTVDIGIDGALPQGARPDLSVDGTIEIENLKDVLYVGRPVHGQPQSTIGIFKLADGGAGAVRVQVKLGRGSVNTIEIVQGLAVGDQVILSDMSAWDNVDRIRLK